MTQKKQYCQLDLFKFLFSIVIVSIHTRLFRDVSETFNWYYLNVFCNLAVPFFFMTSGYLLFGKLKELDIKEQKDKIAKYMGHLLKMYLVWCVLWLPWKILNFYNSGHFTMLDLGGVFKGYYFCQRGRCFVVSAIVNCCSDLLLPVCKSF